MRMLCASENVSVSWAMNSGFVQEALDDCVIIMLIDIMLIE